MASTYPDALDDFADVPANQAELPTHSTNHNAERSAINALQAAVGTADTSRLVQRFADATARDATIPAPTAGMVCAVAGVLQTNLSGTVGGWETVPRITEGGAGGILAQTGNIAADTDGGGLITVVFPLPFTAAPTVIATRVSPVTASLVAHIGAISSTAVSFVCTRDGVLQANVSNIEINWVAFGIGA